MTSVKVAAKAVGGWYVDKCIGRMVLPVILPGYNALEIVIPFGRKSNLEACFILGGFGVRAEGPECTLTEPVKTLYFGDITRLGLPFYGGNITYHMECEINSGAAEIAATCYRGHLLRVSVDGRDAGIIAFSPYRLKIEGLPPGPHKIDLTYYGGRINTFGQLHRIDRHMPWCDPDSWRTRGAAWSYEYSFWPQGVLKSPEIFTRT